MAAVCSPAAAQSCPASYRQKNPQHTACKPRNSWCKIKVSGVDSEQRALILRLHNEFRSETALGRLPGFRSAADMQELLWDDELEYVAQASALEGEAAVIHVVSPSIYAGVPRPAHANLCTTPDGDLKHDNITDRFTNRFPKTGQNLAWEGQSNYIEGSNWTWVMDGWFTQEYGLYPWYNVPHFTPIEGVKIGHFTQIVWAQTRYVGCGYVYYNVDANVPFPHMKHYACNYGPTGNYVGEPIYRPPSQYCTPCPCLPSTPYRYPTPATRYPPPYTTWRRYPPYAQNPAPRRYPLSYNPRLGDDLPRCEDVEGYKPGEPGQPACVEGSGSGGLLSVGDSYGRRDGCPGRDAAIWLYFVAGTATSLTMALLLGAFLVFWRFIGSTDRT
ncbi:hypothetical protein HPB49_012467 [Dermacentor silvarum]|uniref:Uncharacterized protein n=1 Tax=Dermacentor silvarum TaxID=543639 RepID=A0ACB8D5A3_DERSI|nr:hypothetical protein HPB49_012467 [Dermacentor silvarum]